MTSAAPRGNVAVLGAPATTAAALAAQTDRNKIYVSPGLDILLCSKSHNDRVLFEYMSAFWAHIA